MTTALRMPPTIDVNFDSGAFLDDPHAFYARWRRETPVFRAPDGTVYLARYSDCERLLTDRSFVRVPPGGGPNPFSQSDASPNAFELMLSHWLLFMDPPRHDRVRKAFNPPFTPSRLKQMEGCIELLAQELIGNLPPDAPIEFISDFAYPLPVLVICAMLGVPARDRHLFGEWAQHLSRHLDAGTPEDMRAGVSISREMYAYFNAFIDACGRGGQPGFFTELLSSGEAASLSRDELIYGCAFLVWAGHETTKFLIANGILALCENPEQLRKLRSRPELATSAVEELLRYGGPIHKVSRWSSDEASFGEYSVPPGTLITALVAAANRDAGIFGAADRLDICRTPNRHVALGKGIHHCLGAGLARMEARIAFNALLRAFAQIEILDHKWRANSAIRGPEYLMVSLC